MKILRDRLGESIVDESFPECKDCIGKRIKDQVLICPISKKQTRHSEFENSHGSVFECTEVHGWVQSKKVHLSILEKDAALLGRYLEIKTGLSKAYKRLTHNLVSHNAHIIQELESIIGSESALSGGVERQLEKIGQSLSSKKDSVKRGILKIYQSAIGIKNEMDTYDILYGPPSRIVRKRHLLDKVFFNAANKFLSDFHFNRIAIQTNVGSYKDEVLVNFDCMSVSLSHLLDNAKKYCLPDSSVVVSFTKATDKAILQIEMLSLKIESVEEMFSEDSGKLAKQLGLAGSGVGMTTARKLLGKTGCELNVLINADPARSKIVNEVPYEVNIFKISVPLAF